MIEVEASIEDAFLEAGMLTRSIVDGWVAEYEEGKFLDLSSHECHGRMGVYLPITSGRSGLVFFNTASHEGDPASRRSSGFYSRERTGL